MVGAGSNRWDRQGGIYNCWSICLTFGCLGDDEERPLPPAFCASTTNLSKRWASIGRRGTRDPCPPATAYIVHCYSGFFRTSPSHLVSSLPTPLKGPPLCTSLRLVSGRGPNGWTSKRTPHQFAGIGHDRPATLGQSDASASSSSESFSFFFLLFSFFLGCHQRQNEEGQDRIRGAKRRGEVSLPLGKTNKTRHQGSVR